MKRVRPGDNLKITAQDWNEIGRTVDYIRESTLNSGSHAGSLKGPSGIIYVRNNTSYTLEPYTALAIYGSELGPADDGFFNGIPIVAGVIQTADHPWGILQDAVAPGAIGRMMVLGVTPCQIMVRNALHKYAEPAPNDTRGLLQTCDGGPARLLATQQIAGVQWGLVLIGGGSGTDDTYKGYFTLYNASYYDNAGQVVIRVMIVDGATYSPQTGTSGPSVCKVNNATFQLDPVISPDITKTSVFVIKFTSAIPGEGENPETPATCEILMLDKLPSDTKNEAYYQLGRIVVNSNKSFSIIQDHKSNIAQINWFLLCNE